MAPVDVDIFTSAVLHLPCPLWMICVYLEPNCLPSPPPPAPGRVSLTRGASLLLDQLTLEDEGWFECRILVLATEKDDFQNGTWTFLSITGAALQGHTDSPHWPPHHRWLAASPAAPAGPG